MFQILFTDVGFFKANLFFHYINKVRNKFNNGVFKTVMYYPASIHDAM